MVQYIAHIRQKQGLSPAADSQINTRIRTVSALEDLYMTCKEISGMIPAFFDDTLDNESLRVFLNHLDRCKTCREELEIQYLVIRVFNHMDAGGEVNLSRDLPAYIEQERRLLLKRERLAAAAGMMEIAAVITFVITCIIFMM